jgi:hypothetical protein
MIGARLPAILALAAATLSAQTVLDDPKKIADARQLLDAFRGQPVSCEVVPIEPRFNFTLRLQAGYMVRVRRRAVLGEAEQWVTLARVSPQARNRAPVYLSDVVQIPAVPEGDDRGEVGGFFWLGEGRYRVKWLMFDRHGETCRKAWSIEARLKPAERLLNPVLPPATVAGVSWSRGVRTSENRPLSGRLTILLHAASLDQLKTGIGTRDSALLLDALWGLMDQLPARSVRLVIFSLDQQQEYYRKDRITLATLPDVSKTLDSIPWAMDYRLLQNPSGTVDLIENLATGEMRASDPSDAVIFLGAHSIYDGKPSDSLVRARTSRQQFFYLMCANTSSRRGFLSAPAGGGGGSGGGGWSGGRRALEIPPEVQGPTVYSGHPRISGARSNYGPDSIQYAVERLGGRVLKVDSPDSFAKAVGEIARNLSAAR